MRRSSRRSLRTHARYTAGGNARNVAKRGQIPAATIDQVYWMCGGNCAKCLVRLSPRGGLPHSFHIDHVIPHSLGGGDALSNLQPLCRSCNTSKGNRSSHDHRPDDVRRRYGTADRRLRVDDRATLRAVPQQMVHAEAMLKAVRRRDDEARLRSLHAEIEKGLGGIDEWYADAHVEEFAFAYAEEFAAAVWKRQSPTVDGWVTSHWPTLKSFVDYVASYASWVLYERRPPPTEEQRRQVGPGVETVVRMVLLNMPPGFYDSEELRVNIESQMLQILARDGQVGKVDVEVPKEGDSEYWPTLVKQT